MNLKTVYKGTREVGIKELDEYEHSIGFIISLVYSKRYTY